MNVLAVSLSSCLRATSPPGVVFESLRRPLAVMSDFARQSHRVESSDRQQQRDKLPGVGGDERVRRSSGSAAGVSRATSNLSSRDAQQRQQLQLARARRERRQAGRQRRERRSRSAGRHSYSHGHRSGFGRPRTSASPGSSGGVHPRKGVGLGPSDTGGARGRGRRRRSSQRTRSRERAGAGRPRSSSRSRTLHGAHGVLPHSAPDEDNTMRRVQSASDLRRQVPLDVPQSPGMASVSDQLRQMQHEFSLLNRKVKEHQEDNTQWAVRYTRRLLVSSNVALALWVFSRRFLACVTALDTKMNAPLRVVGQWVLPALLGAPSSMFSSSARHQSAGAASPLNAKGAAGRRRLLLVIGVAFLKGESFLQLQCWHTLLVYSRLLCPA